MKTICSAVAACALLVTAATPLQSQAASSITGDISFVGGVDLDSPIGTAIKFTSIYDGFYGPPDGPTVSATHGSYSAVGLGTSATFTAFTFSPSPISITPLFTFSANGTTYSFDVTSVTYYSKDSAFINLAGSGVAHISGASDTPGTWSITVDVASSTQTYGTFGAYISVPEPSSLSLVFSAGIAVLFGRKLSRK
jgi:hypothetical protein